MLTETQFLELYKHKNRIYRLCYQFSPSDASDWTQDVFMKAWQARDQFIELAAPYTWLHRIAINHCLMKTRSYRDIFFVPVDDVELIHRPQQYNMVLAQELLNIMRPNEARANVNLITGLGGNDTRDRSSRLRGRSRVRG